MTTALSNRYRLTTAIAAGLAMLFTWSTSVAQTTTPPGPESDKINQPEPLENYMGREIARTMHYTGADWLIRDEREREERCSAVLANLGLKTGMTVCDIGCGNGYYAIPIAKLLGKSGRVVGVDIQPEMLKMLRDRMLDQGVHNITPILGMAFDPCLPDHSVDLILMVDVYHEFAYPEPMLTAMRKALKPNGLIVLVEYRAEDETVPIKPEHKMSKEQVDKELKANGFELDHEFDGLPWQHMLFYKKAESNGVPDGSTPVKEITARSQTVDFSEPANIDRLVALLAFRIIVPTSLENSSRLPS